MTQAFNLSQFANRLNSSGALSSALPIAEGGTNNGSLAVTAGGVLYTDGSKVVNVGAGTAGQALLSNGSSAPYWGSGGLTGMQAAVFTASGTWAVPSGVTRAVVLVVGGGGGGGTVSGAYGGSGGAAWVDVTGLSGSISITIGAGGNAQSSGGASSFGSYVTCNGGSGGSGTASGVDGSVTISSGTAIRYNTSSVGSVATYISTGSPLCGNGSYSPNTTGVAFSISANYTAGVGGAGGTSTRYGGVGGAILIYY